MTQQQYKAIFIDKNNLKSRGVISHLLSFVYLIELPCVYVDSNKIRIYHKSGR